MSLCCFRRCRKRGIDNRFCRDVVPGHFHRIALPQLQKPACFFKRGFFVKRGAKAAKKQMSKCFSVVILSALLLLLASNLCCGGASSVGSPTAPFPPIVPHPLQFANGSWNIFVDGNHMKVTHTGYGEKEIQSAFTRFLRAYVRSPSRGAECDFYRGWWISRSQHLRPIFNLESTSSTFSQLMA